MSQHHHQQHPAAAVSAAAVAAAGNYMQPMMMPGYAPNPGYFQPVYLMDHNNQIHMINMQVSTYT